MPAPSGHKALASASPTSKLAWYYTHVGEIEMLHQLGIIERPTFEALSAEWREHSPLKAC